MTSAFFCVALAAATALPPPGSATDAIRGGNDKLRGLLQKDASSGDLTHAMRDLFDIQLLTERALKDHWDGMDPKQRTEMVNTLQGIMERNYLSQLRGNLDYQVDYLDEEGTGEDALVHTVIRAKNKGRPTRIRVDYKLHYGSEHWRIYDVMTEQVSILNNYRSQFNRIIAKEGVPGLLTRMKSRLDAPRG